MLSQSRRRVAAALAVAALLSAACSAGGTSAGSEPSGSAELRPVSVVLDWTPNTNHSGLYLARSQGYFAEEGLEVEVVEPGETSGSQLVTTGHADFAYSVSESLVPARIAGADLVSIAAVVQHNTSSLISLTETGITRPRDLAGRRYGSYQSDLERALIGALVACDGGDPTAVEYTPLVSDDFRIGLTQDQFDVAWVFDGWDTIRLRDVDGLDVSTLAFIDYTECIPDWYTPIVVTSQQTMDEDPDVVRAFTAALSRGYQKAMTDPHAAAEALLKASPELDRELVERSAQYLAERYADDPARWGRQNAATWDEFVAFLVRSGIIEDGFDTSAAWTDQFLPRT